MDITLQEAPSGELCTYHIPSELIDVSFGSLADTEFRENLQAGDAASSFEAYTRVDRSLGGIRVPTLRYLVEDDLRRMLFGDTGNRPWADQKYAKRYTRLLLGITVLSLDDEIVAQPVNQERRTRTRFFPRVNVVSLDVALMEKQVEDALANFSHGGSWTRVLNRNKPRFACRFFAMLADDLSRSAEVEAESDRFRELLELTKGLLVVIRTDILGLLKRDMRLSTLPKTALKRTKSNESRASSTVNVSSRPPPSLRHKRSASKAAVVLDGLSQFGLLANSKSVPSSTRALANSKSVPSSTRAKKNAAPP